MFTFAVRPGYTTKELLIEFRSGSGSDEMIRAMWQVFDKFEIKVISKEDFWGNDEIIYKMQSAFGGFDLSSDNHGFIFILAPENQATIKSLAALLSESGFFQCEENSFEQHP
jgi:hypothetical protein